MHILQETSKTPRVNVYMLAMLLLAVLICDVGHATIELTNLTNYSVRFLSSFISF